MLQRRTRRCLDATGSGRSEQAAPWGPPSRPPRSTLCDAPLTRRPTRRARRRPRRRSFLLRPRLLQHRLRPQTLQPLRCRPCRRYRPCRRCRPCRRRRHRLHPPLPRRRPRPRSLRCRPNRRCRRHHRRCHHHRMQPSALQPNPRQPSVACASSCLSIPPSKSSHSERLSTDDRARNVTTPRHASYRRNIALLFRVPDGRWPCALQAHRAGRRMTLSDRTRRVGAPLFHDDGFTAPRRETAALAPLSSAPEARRSSARRTPSRAPPRQPQHATAASLQRRARRKSRGPS